MTTLVVGLTVLLACPLGAQSDVNSSEAGRRPGVASTVHAAKVAIIGDCGISAAIADAHCSLTWHSAMQYLSH